MEHPIHRSIDSDEDDPALSVTALVVVLARIFSFYFAVRVALPELPDNLHHFLADLPSASEQAAIALSMLQ